MPRNTVTFDIKGPDAAKLRMLIEDTLCDNISDEDFEIDVEGETFIFTSPAEDEDEEEE